LQVADIEREIGMGQIEELIEEVRARQQRACSRVILLV